MEKHPASQYYSQVTGKALAPLKIAETSNVSKDVAQQWPFKQALGQIYLPGPRYVPRPKLDVPADTQRRPPS